MTSTAGNGTVLWALDARGVATVTFNRPQVNNAYNGDLIQGVFHSSRVTASQRSSNRHPSESPCRLETHSGRTREP